MEVQRLGKKKTSTSTRPVKVRLSSSLIVHQIVYNARKVRLSAKFKTVFLSPDRSIEERKVRKELITDMKAKTLAEPFSCISKRDRYSVLIATPECSYSYIL